MATYKKNNFFSCSFPLHRLMVHVKKLVTHGCKVGIVRQKETTALKAVGASKHAPFKRELEIVYTKATLIVDEDCDGVIDVQCVDIPLCIIFVAEAYAKTDGSTAQIGILAFFTQDAKCIFDHFQDDCARSRLDSNLLESCTNAHVPCSNINFLIRFIDTPAAGRDSIARSRNH
jgi:DNA mismatch repair protein MSH3